MCENGYARPYQFVVVNPDHVSTVESGRALFAATAALSVAGDAILVAVSVWFLVRSVWARREKGGRETAPE